MDLRDYVLINMDTGQVFADPRRVRLVNDENMIFDADVEPEILIELAENLGISLREFAEDSTLER